MLEVKRDPSMRRVDDVWVKGGAGDASSIAAALYMPNGKEGLVFSTQVDATAASKIPAQESLALAAQTETTDQAPQQRARTM
jgi:hypothetical protein